MTDIWQSLAEPVFNRLSDLFGARFTIGPIIVKNGGWKALRSEMPDSITAVAATLDGGINGEIGLVWALAEAGNSEHWTKNPQTQADFWELVGEGITEGLSVVMNTAVRVLARTEPQTGSPDMLESNSEQQVLVGMEATGDGITVFIGLVMPEQIAAAVKSGKSAAKLNHTLSTRPHLGELSGESNLAPPRELDVVLDLPLHLTVEVGKMRVLLKDVLALGKGSVVELDRPAGDLVDVFVNGKLIAKGEIVVLPDGNYGVRVVEVISSKDRLNNLQTN